jgi:hypothetical protein
MGTSQLGGVVYGNPNLNQNADIILNEVGSLSLIALEIMLTSFVSLAYKPSLSMIKSEVRSLLILNLVITPSGAILNNSKVMGTSQLGGVVYGNPNLNQNADIILSV